MESSRAITTNHGEFNNLARAILGKGLTLRFQARGVSMHPFVRSGEILDIATISAENLSVGDLVLFQRAPSSLAVHRVIRRVETADGLAFLVKGDSLRHPDGLVKPAAILGKVTASERNGARHDLTRRSWRAANFCVALFSPYLPRLLSLVRRRRSVTLVSERAR